MAHCTLILRNLYAHQTQTSGSSVFPLLALQYLVLAEDQAPSRVEATAELLACSSVLPSPPVLWTYRTTEL